MFRTEISIDPSPARISMQDSIFSIGSCFAGVIGQRMKGFKFNTLINPFGTLYNPASIFGLLHDSLSHRLPSEASYVQRQELHYNFKYHSDLVAEDRKTLEKMISEKLQQAHTFLEEAGWIIVTLGTARCYERVDDGKVVANCHKMPASFFRRRMLSPEEMSIRFEQLYPAIKSRNQNVKFVFTVSPVRHIKDTLTQNATSKASLRLAVDNIISNHPDDVFYFPSYEIMLDDLRDYRFYAPDMIHPNEVAQDYIWEKWVDTYLDEQSLEFMIRWEKIRQALQHRPFHPASDEHQRFVKKTIEQLQQLSTVVDVNEELKRMRKQLL